MASHIKDIFNALVAVGLNRNRADEMRQAAFSVISNTIESAGALFSPAAAEGGAEKEGEEDGLSEEDKMAMLTKMLDAPTHCVERRGR